MLDGLIVVILGFKVFMVGCVCNEISILVL